MKSLRTPLSEDDTPSAISHTIGQGNYHDGFRLLTGQRSRRITAYSSLPGFQSYRELWQQTYESRAFLIKHAGRAAKNRTAFYHLGMGKALALDRVSPGWKEKYFLPGAWLDDLLADATGRVR